MPADEHTPNAAEPLGGSLAPKTEPVQEGQASGPPGAWQPVPTRRTVMPAAAQGQPEAPLRTLGSDSLASSHKLLWAAVGSAITLLALGIRNVVRR